jgi:ribosomal protein L7/L12
VANQQVLCIQLSEGMAELRVPVRLSEADLEKLRNLHKVLELFSSVTPVPEAAPAAQAAAVVRVTLLECGRSKIETVKLVRQWFGANLAEAKHQVENVPVELGCVAADKEPRLRDAFFHIGALIDTVVG